MVRVIGVRFRTEGKIYFFDPLQFEIKRGDNLIVETVRGVEFGTAVSDIKEVEEEAVVAPLKPILRIADERDKEQVNANREKEKEAFRICQEKIRRHGLEMKLIDAEYTFDNNKLLFHFTADGRVDFRELVKDLAGIFKTRIELRQIGARDETRILGGIGICGRSLCCHTFLPDLQKAVSIKMAKEQNLSLNPAKISGVCGRLMCCLKNEAETYEELNRQLPNTGDYCITPDGQRGEVHSVNVLRQRVKVLVEAGDDKEIKEFEAAELKFHKHHGKKGPQEEPKEEELRELQKLEQEEEQEGTLSSAEGEGTARRREGNDRRGRGAAQGHEHASHTGEKQKKDREYGVSHGDKKERQERQERTNQARPERQNRPEGAGQGKTERQGRSDGAEQGKTERQNRTEWQTRQGQGRAERQGQGRADRAEKQGHTDRQSQDRRERSERQGNASDRRDRTDKAADRRDRTERPAAAADRGEREVRRDHRDRQQERQGHGRGEGTQGKSYRDRNRSAGHDRQEQRQQNPRPRQGKPQENHGQASDKGE